MSNILDLEKLFHRSKERIKNLGEVFTPEYYVEEMLDLISKDKKGFWSDEDITFFEPCAGHGNIIIPIFKRRLEAIHKKASTQGIRDAAFYAVANTINTLWAIDIDKKNIESCRSRILDASIEFLKIKLNAKTHLSMIGKKREFFAHLMAAINWQISENETLSALSKPTLAKASANQTKSGANWFGKNGSKQLNFHLTWVDFYEQCEAGNSIPLEYERAIRFIDGLLSGKNRGFEEFDFAKQILQGEKATEMVRKPNRSFSVGA